MADYGRRLGTAFQLIDDVLDYDSSAGALGKNIGDDLAEGKPTLPLLYALWHGAEADRAVIRAAIKNGGRQDIEQIKQAIHASGAIDYTAALAHNEARLAMAALPELPASDYLDALYALAKFSVNRHY